MMGVDGFPKKIIYLRDGVSDTGADAVVNGEVRAINDVYSAVGQPLPKILAIAVRRAHQTRFFPTNMSDPRTNMPPGTLVFDNLSMPLPYPNFYLLTHAGIKGTSHPARYVVLRDEFKDTVVRKTDRERLEFYAHLIFQLAHLYGRCQRSVSVPAPVYYATLLAERGRAHISEICRSAFGIGLFSDTESNASAPKITMQADQSEKFCMDMNKRLKDVEAGASPMFYV